MLPDVLTEGDNLEMPPLPDASFLLSQIDDDAHVGRRRRASSRDINLQEDFNNSQFLQNSIENRNAFDDDDLALDPMDDIDLGLDLGLDIDDNMHSKNDRSIEIGREAPAARAAEDDLLSEFDIQVRAKDFDRTRDHDMTLDLALGNDDGIHMADDGDVDMFGIGDQPDVSALPVAPVIDRTRISESPLSDVNENAASGAEKQHNLDSALYEPEEDNEQSTLIHPVQRVRRQKLIRPDVQTTIPNSQIKEQQANRDKIIRPQSFLPRDPELLALMEMQRNGGFVSNIMREGRSLGWAPELRGLLSLDSVRKTGDLKRKRDSGIADMDSDAEGPHKSPRLELGEAEEDLGAGLGSGALGREDTAIAADGTIMEMAGDDGFVMDLGDDDHNANAGLVDSPGPNFDETTAPLVHPADSGPVSLGTKHAVHLLRDRFGAEAADSPDKRKKASVLFQDLLPEATTSRADATKMFFEVLVLATKDAVKVEQQEALLGGPIRVRGKRGLWGAWAEREAGGEIEEEAAPNVGLEALQPVLVAA